MPGSSLLFLLLKLILKEKENKKDINQGQWVDGNVRQANRCVASVQALLLRSNAYNNATSANPY